MTVSYALLGLLEESPRHGYELKREYDSHFRQLRPVQFGQIYSTLSRLQRDGRTRLKGEEPGRGPGRKLYSITDLGIDDLDRWLRTPEPASPHIQSTLFVKVVLALLSGRPARRLLEAQRTRHMQRMRKLTRMKDSGTPADTLVIDYALFHLEADLRWMELTAARLHQLRREVRA